MPGAQDNVGSRHNRTAFGITVPLLPLGAVEVEQFPGLFLWRGIGEGERVGAGNQAPSGRELC